MPDNDIEVIRHSAAHILAQAVLRLYPNTKLGIGPATDKGFYHDFDLEIPTNITEKQFLQQLEEEVQGIIEEELPFQKVLVPKEEAITMLNSQGQIFKSELLQQVAEDEICFYKTGNEYIDLGRGPHVSNTGKVGAIKLTQVKDNVHWLNDTERPKLLRIYGMAFKTKKDLEEYERLKEEMKKRDHKIIGEELNIFKKTDITGSNNHILLTNGVKIKNNIITEYSQILEEANFKQIELENIWTKELEQTRQKLLNASETIDIENSFKIVNSPLAQLIDLTLSSTSDTIEENAPSAQQEYYYVNKLYSLKAKKSKNEANKNFYNSLTVDQLKGSLVTSYSDFEKTLQKNIQIFLEFYKVTGLDDLYFEVSIADEKIYKIVFDLLTSHNLSVKKISTNDYFKISIKQQDMFEKDWVVGEIKSYDNLNQYILKNISSKLKQLAESSKEATNEGKFKLLFLDITFIANIKELIAKLIEKYNGELPLEISAFQAVILPVTEEELSHAKLVKKSLINKGLRVKIIYSAQSYNDRIELALKHRYPYILTIGQQEVKNDVFSVKPSHGEDLGLMTTEEFLQKINSLS